MIDITEPQSQIPLDLYISDESGVEIEETDGDPVTEPFDPTLIRVTTSPLTVDLLVSRIKHGEIDLAPSFQRKGGLWKDDVQSRLIESLLIKIPLPAFYMDATDENKWLLPINKALFEALSVNIDMLSETSLNTLYKRKDIARNRLNELLLDTDFDAAISTGTGNTARVHLRFQAIELLL